MVAYYRGWRHESEAFSPHEVALFNARIDEADREREMRRNARDCGGCWADCTWCGVHGHDFQWHEGW